MAELERLTDTLGHTLARLEDRGRWTLDLARRHESPQPADISVDEGTELVPPLVWRTVDSLT